MQMMKHKRSLSNYVTSCGPWHNEGKGPRKSFWNCFFHSGQDGLHTLVRGTRQRNRGGSPFKNQFTDNKNQEVVVCVARGCTSLLLAAPEVQTHHWVTQQQPLSYLWQSPTFPASPIRIQTTLETQYRRQRRIFVCLFLSPPFLQADYYPFRYHHESQESNSQSSACWGGAGVWLGHNSSRPVKRSIYSMNKQISLPLSISSSHPPTLSSSTSLKNFPKKALLEKS